MGRSLCPPISRGSRKSTCHLSLVIPTWSRRWQEMCSGTCMDGPYCVLWKIRRHMLCTKTQYCLDILYYNNIYYNIGLFCSYSIILLEIATRSDPIPVSRPSCVTWPANRLLLFRVSGGLLRKTMCFRLRSQMWRAHGVLLCLSSSPLRPTAPVPVQLTTWRYVHPKSPSYC